MRYFPLTKDHFEHQFGIRALTSSQSIIEKTDRYTSEIKLKQRLLHEDQANYFQALPGSESAQQEAAAAIITAATFLKHDADRPIGEPPTLLSVAPLVQEDLAILDGDPQSGHRLIAGVVCFPSGWSIRDKIGKSLLSVHRPVPDYESVMSRSTDRLLEQLKPGRPVWRMNWGVRPSRALDQSPKHAQRLRDELSSITVENAGQRCYFRVERQTLSRLPETSCILFTIHTHQCPLGQLADWQQRNLRGVLQSCPDETLSYKGITPLKNVVQAYLARRQERP